MEMVGDGSPSQSFLFHRVRCHKLPRISNDFCTFKREIVFIRGGRWGSLIFFFLDIFKSTIGVKNEEQTRRKIKSGVIGNNIYAK